MSKVINIRGDIITDDWAEIYEWLGELYTSPGQVEALLSEAVDADEDVLVRINSGGGQLMAGQEIYSLLHDMGVDVEITGIAASAAGMIAMAGKTVKMHPVSMIMVHNVIGTFEGDYHDMRHGATVLQELNAAVAAAFVEKSGMSTEDVLGIMDKETWLTADKAIEYGFADAIVHTDAKETNAANGLSITPEQIALAKYEIAAEKQRKVAAAERESEKARLALELSLI